LYIPEERMVSLVEVQFTVLPEDEWLLGLSDLAYFQGVGFSMPIPFDFNQYFIGEPPEIRAEEFSKEDSEVGSPFSQSEGTDYQKGLSIISDESRPHIEQDDAAEFSLDGPKPVLQHTETSILDSLANPDVSTLYAFLPGFFYCSKQNCTVDGVVVEVSQNRILEMTLSSFRPESIRSFDMTRAMAIDENGQLTDVEISMATTGRFTTGISIGSDEDYEEDSVPEQLSMKQAAFSNEIKIAIQLQKMFSPDALKRVYLSGSIVTGQLMTLLHDIETNGLNPRYKIYLRNRRYPDGTIVDVRYRSLDSIVNLTSQSGIECPRDAALELELRKLAFAKLTERQMEVDIEMSVIDTCNFLRQELGQSPSKTLLLDKIFKEARS